jgi:hypothetical protein
VDKNIEIAFRYGKRQAHTWASPEMAANFTIGSAVKLDDCEEVPNGEYRIYDRVITMTHNFLAIKRIDLHIKKQKFSPGNLLRR